MSEYKRKYYISDEAWYAKLPSHIPYNDVMFGLYDENCCTLGDMGMHWSNVSGNTAQLKVYAEAFGVLATFSDVITALGEHRTKSKELSRDEFVAILIACGFEDHTTYENPNC